MSPAIETRPDEEWQHLHAMLRGLARQRFALEAREADLLVEAEDTRLYRRLGYATMAEYLERELGYSAHTASERLRVARELLGLPLLSADLRGRDRVLDRPRADARRDRGDRGGVATSGARQDGPRCRAHGRRAASRCETR